ncbi:MAG: DNA repair protein RadC [Candidatus Omnitrophica bacterium]|nr:DNA repair protein RadC [Candidatus Omnitrophota bacterium]
MAKYNIPINNWPKEDRPREKLLRLGEHTLSDSELLAIIIRCGRHGLSAVDLARRILRKFKTLRNLSHTDPGQWEEFRGLGLGSVKIAQIKAALELGRRLKETEVKLSRPRLESSADVAGILMPRLRDLKKEVFKVIFLDSQSRIIEIIEAGEGTVNQAKPILREIYHRALQSFAPFLICVHNHPAGNPEPSAEDKKFTQQLIKAGEVLSVKALDHIIIGNGRYFSFLDAGLI